ncbi:glycosyltransferase family 1 protein [Sphingobium lactosutens]|uniref:glycosyltransferase family 4 protein n=1 Tax=Sphingobium lactosutens TaxID=522773 RepID=UPI0015BF4E0B|nr:glycosyltransferase family 1 protein [Sphingobium lactosutens]NWK94274.1 glycosyltransferase family 1 protein [Sphingobium lactosutens]
MKWLAGLLERFVSTAMGRSATGPFAPRRLLVDVSTIAQHDAGTGIQRVVRAIWLHLHRMDLGDVMLLPIAATARRGYGIARFDRETGRLSLPETDAPLLQAGAGDMFLGLDLAAHRLSRHERQIARWRRRGATIHILVYDLLPLQRPEWFPESTGRNFRKWINVLARRADSAICISRQVAADLDDWLAAMKAPRRMAIVRPVISLSGAVEATNPTQGIGERGHDAIRRARKRQTVLMVGTVEPRKGHDCVLDAMAHLWRVAGEDAPDLLLVGRPGWRTETLQARMRSLEAEGARFTWLEQASDELLNALYACAALVVMPSRGEGFGLPIVEALWQGRKVLARDLPVFRELARPGLFYFDDEAPDALGAHILNVLREPDPAPWAMDGWDDSAMALLRALGVTVDPDAVGDRPLVS